MLQYEIMNEKTDTPPGWYRIYANKTVDKKIISKFTFVRLDS